MICTGVSKDNNQFDLEIKVTLNTGRRHDKQAIET